MRVAGRLRLILFCALACPGTVAAQPRSGGELLVLSKHDQTLAVVDPVSLQVVAKVPVGRDPHEVVASSDGATAYVSNYGGGTLRTLAVVDLTKREPLPPIDLGPLIGPHGLAFADGKLWFTAEAAKAIGRYDPATRSLDLVLGTGQNRTHMIYVAPEGEGIMTANVNSATVSLIGRKPVQRAPRPAPPGVSGGPVPSGPNGPGEQKDWDQTVVPVGNGAEGFDLSPDGKEIWVANALDGTISILDRSVGRVVETLAAKVDGANRLKFSLDGHYVLVSLVHSPDLVILDAHTRRGVRRLPIGHGAEGILIDPNGSRAFVACTPDNVIAVVDLNSLAVVGRIQVGAEPDGMAWAVRR